MRAAVINFIKGLTFTHVRWEVRHHSRAYERGQATAFVLILAAVPAALLVAGVIIGLMIGHYER
jgi:hypothetical protein